MDAKRAAGDRRASAASSVSSASSASTSGGSTPASETASEGEVEDDERTKDRDDDPAAAKARTSRRRPRHDALALTAATGTPHSDDEDEVSLEETRVSIFGDEFVPGCGCPCGQRLCAERDQGVHDDEGHGCGAICKVSKAQALCLDLSEAPLPKLQGGFWGTALLVKSVKCSPNLRQKYGPWLLGVYTCVILGAFLALAYMDYMGMADERPTPVSCSAQYWANASALDKDCGLAGLDCRPLETESWYTLRCPGHCLNDYSTPVYGSDIYTATSRVCAAAIHAGVIGAREGGCFDIQFLGPQTNYSFSTQNGVASEAFNGWFPRSFQVRAVTNGQCNALRAWMDAYIFMAMFVTFLLVRPSPWYLFLVINFTGYLYLVTEYRYYDSFAVVLNERSTRLLVIFLAAATLWRPIVRNTFPDPRTHPIDGLLFYFLPFWFGIHFDMFENLGIDTTLTTGGLASAGAILGIALIVGIGIPLVALQLALFHRARMLRKVLLYAILTALVVMAVSLSTAEYLNVHLHHYMFGGLGMMLFQGQPRLRYSIMLQGGLLGVFVNGVTIWDIAPLYDTASSSDDSSNPYMYWSEINRSGFELNVVWAPKETVFGEWGCSQSGLEAFAQNYRDFIDSSAENETDGYGEIPDFEETASINATVPETISAKSVEMASSVFVEDESATEGMRLGSSGGGSGRRLVQAAPQLIPDDDSPIFWVSGNSVMLTRQLYEANATTYTADLNLGVPGSLFYLTAGNYQTYTRTIQFQMPADAAASDPVQPGAGMYNTEAADFSDPCQRVYAFFLISRRLLPS